MCFITIMCFYNNIFSGGKVNLVGAVGRSKSIVVFKHSQVHYYVHILK